MERLPILSREKVDYTVSYYMALVQFIAGLAEQSLESKKAREKLEERVQERTAELAEAKRSLEDIFDNTAEAIDLTDRHGNLTKWNKAAEAIYGYAFAELEGKPAHDLYADQDDRRRMIVRLRLDNAIRDYEIDMKSKDGNIFPCSLSVKILRDE